MMFDEEMLFFWGFFSKMIPVCNDSEETMESADFEAVVGFRWFWRWRSRPHVQQKAAPKFFGCKKIWPKKGKEKREEDP